MLEENQYQVYQGYSGQAANGRAPLKTIEKKKSSGENQMFVRKIQQVPADYTRDTHRNS